MTKKLISIGVDPGSRNGAIAIMDEDMHILHLGKAPFYLIESTSPSGNTLSIVEDESSSSSP